MAPPIVPPPFFLLLLAVAPRCGNYNRPSDELIRVLHTPALHPERQSAQVAALLHPRLHIVSIGEDNVAMTPVLHQPDVRLLRRLHIVGIGGDNVAITRVLHRRDVRLIRRLHIVGIGGDNVAMTRVLHLPDVRLIRALLCEAGKARQSDEGE